MLRSVVLALALCFVAAGALQLTSQDFTNGGTIPKELSCDNAPYGLSPDLRWNDIPAGTKSLALVMYDLTSYGIFYHWFVTGLSTSTNQLLRGGSVSLPQGSRPVLNYIPVCPPHGKAHVYKLELFALAEDLTLDDDLNVALDQLRTHSLSSTILIGSYGGAPSQPQSTQPTQSNPVSGQRKPTVGHVGSHYARFVKQVEAIPLAPNTTVTLLSNDIFPFLQTDVVRGFIFPAVSISNPGNGFDKRLRASFRLTLLSGPDICFNADFVGKPMQTTDSQVCATAAQRTVFISLENVDPLPTGDVKFWLVAMKNGTGSTQWQGSVNVTVAQDDFVEDILNVQYNTLAELLIPYSEFRRVHLFPYLLIPAVPQGGSLKVTVIVNITVLNGDFPLCFAGSFVPIRNLLSKANPKFQCKEPNSGTFLLRWTRVIQYAELPPPQPYLLVASTSSIAKRNTPSAAYSLYASEPTYTVMDPPAPKPATFTFTFANMFKGAAKRATRP